MRKRLILLAVLLPTGSIAATGVEHWMAVSTTAMGITGDITLSPTRLTMGKTTLPLRVAADVPAFQSSSGPVAARILRVTRPSNPMLLHGNRLCRATWIVVWRQHQFGQTNLDMAVFSSASQPTGENAPGLCGTFLYGRA